MTSRRKKPLWRRAFLRALARTGNVRAAARMAGVDHSTVYLARGRDAGFAERWVAALRLRSGQAGEEGRARVGGVKVPSPRSLRESPSMPQPCPPDTAKGGFDPAMAGGEGLVVRVSRNNGTQLVKAGAGRWSARAEGVFLAAVARTGCVRSAADACGFSTTALYNRRRHYPDFAARWGEAEAMARERLPVLLTAAAIAGLDPEIADAELPPVNVDQAIRICTMKGWGGASAPPPIEEEPIEAVRARILERIERIEAARARNAED